MFNILNNDYLLPVQVDKPARPSESSLVTPSAASVGHMTLLARRTGATSLPF